MFYGRVCQFEEKFILKRNYLGFNGTHYLQMEQEWGLPLHPMSMLGYWLMICTYKLFMSRIETRKETGSLLLKVSCIRNHQTDYYEFTSQFTKICLQGGLNKTKELLLELESITYLVFYCFSNKICCRVGISKSVPRIC